MKHLFKIVLLISLFVPTLLFSQAEKVRNTPYIDQRRIHFGFMLGMHTQAVSFTHSGYVRENWVTWFGEIPDFSPVFSFGPGFALAFSENLNL